MKAHIFLITLKTEIFNWFQVLKDYFNIQCSLKKENVFNNLGDSDVIFM